MIRYISHLILVVIMILSFGLSGKIAVSTVEPLICSECQYENTLANKFCSACGESLSEEYSQWLVERQGQEYRQSSFISERVDPPRLFSIPTGQVLGSLEIRLVGGGAFGVATDKSFLGTIGIGLGDIAEVEFSTVGMVTNISRGSAVIPTSAFKLLLIPENRWHIPTLAVAFRSSSNWQDIQSDDKVLRAAGNTFVDEVAGMIRNIGYDSRFTTMYGITTIRFWSLSLHAGVSLTDVRVKELSVDYYYDENYSDPIEKQRNLIGGFFGFDIESNPQTKLMFEVKTVSNYQYNIDSKIIDVSQAYQAIGGIRFFFNRWLSTDVGVWYQSSYRGIADMQIKLGLNLFIPGGNIAGKIQNFMSR